ncbi:MAG TPA: contact-dependent growth inhibition system immunity protein [Phycisphaerae bacterium]|nr:contact-dependent growth inhibition system immunity protein [Phycisphaerae bacterium]
MQPEEIPDLAHFLITYLHQDFDLDYADDIEVLLEFLSDNPPETAKSLLRDLRYVLYSDLSNDEVRRLILQCGSSFDPSSAGLTGREWLAEVEKEVLDWKPSD